MYNKVLKVKLLHKDAKLPVRAHPTDAGMDLQSVQDTILYPSERLAIPTGISIALDKGYVGYVFGRSGLGKLGVTLANCVGVIDQAYRGEIKVLLENNGTEPLHIKVGDRIAQLVIQTVYTPVAVVYEGTEEDWVDTDRGTGGFGSTGLGA